MPSAEWKEYWDLLMFVGRENVVEGLHREVALGPKVLTTGWLTRIGKDVK